MHEPIRTNITDIFFLFFAKITGFFKNQFLHPIVDFSWICSNSPRSPFWSFASCLWRWGGGRLDIGGILPDHHLCSSDTPHLPSQDNTHTNAPYPGIHIRRTLTFILSTIHRCPQPKSLPKWCCIHYSKECDMSVCVSMKTETETCLFYSDQLFDVEQSIRVGCSLLATVKDATSQILISGFWTFAMASCAKRHHGTFLSYECRHFNAFSWKPTDNQSWSLFGTLSSSTSLSEDFTQRFKRNLRTIILFFSIFCQSLSLKSIPEFPASEYVSHLCVTHTQTMTQFPTIVKKVAFKLPPQKPSFVGNTVSWGLLQRWFPQCLPNHNYCACMCLKDLCFATRIHLGQPLLQSVSCKHVPPPPINPFLKKCASL